MTLQLPQQLQPVLVRQLAHRPVQLQPQLGKKFSFKMVLQGA